MVGVVLLLLAGCTAIGGQAAPADPTTPAPTTALPARPREVRIDGVDPCTLLTEAQRGELGLDARPRLDVGPLPPYPAADIPLCVMAGFTPRAVSVAISVVTTAGIESFTSGDLVADLRVIEVAGYPAALARPTSYTDFCTVVVDVAQGQALDVNFRTGGRPPPIPQDQLCRDAQRAADAAMSTLLTLR